MVYWFLKSNSSLKKGIKKVIPDHKAYVFGEIARKSLIAPGKHPGMDETTRKKLEEYFKGWKQDVADMAEKAEILQK
jgi:hypothetical protein